MPNNTALGPGYGGDLISDEDITGVSPLVKTTTTGTGTVSTSSFTIAVTSTTGLSSSGYVWLYANNCSQLVLVAYTGTSGGTSLTGCTCDPVTATLGPSSVAPTWATGAVVAQAAIKIPRSKIVLGANGTDGGDISASNPLPVQAFKDQSRTFLSLTTTAQASSTTTTVTALTALVQNSGGTPTTGVTAFVVPASDILVLESFSATVIANSTTTTLANGLQCVYVDVRVATTNTTTALTTAPILDTIAIPLQAYQANTTSAPALGGSISHNFGGDGVQVAAGSYIGITVHNNQTTIATTLLSVSVVGYVVPAA